MQRRALIVALATGMTAGCSGFFDSSDARFGHFDLLNYDDEPRVFQLEIERGGESVEQLSRRVRSDVPSTIPVADRT